MKKITPQPPEDTCYIEKIPNTDSFDCYAKGREFLATIHRPLHSKCVPHCDKDGAWYWKEVTYSEEIECYYCPHCRFRMTDIEYISIKVDAACPRCSTPISKFLPQYKAYFSTMNDIW